MVVKMQAIYGECQCSLLCHWQWLGSSKQKLWPSLYFHDCLTYRHSCTYSKPINPHIAQLFHLISTGVSFIHFDVTTYKCGPYNYYCVIEVDSAIVAGVSVMWL